MKIISWNVNGIRSVHNKGLLQPVIDQIQPNIVCLQETKAEKHQSPVDLPEYDEYWNSSQIKKGYSGVAIFSKQIPISIINGLPEAIISKYELDNDKYGNPNDEGRIITIELADFYLINVYTPNSKPDLSRLDLRHNKWDPAFLEFCKQLSIKKPVIMCGDFNVAHTPNDLANPKQNTGTHGYTKEEREGVDKLIDAGFTDTFRLYTQGNGHYSWWSNFGKARERNIGWRIDYFFASSSLITRITGAKIHQRFSGSDHCPIELDLNVH